MENLGSILREKRKSMGMSLEQVSEELRIKLEYLEALEDERYEILPAPLYKKIFLKAYADYLDLDFEELSDKFEIKKKKKEKETESQLTGISPTDKSSYTLFLIIIAIILGLISFFVFLKHRKTEADYQKPSLETKVENKVNEESKQISETERKIDEEQIPSQPEEMTLRLEGLDKTWALILGDGDTLFSGFINEDMNVECKTQTRFKITLGRAWVVKGYLNGIKLKPFALQGKSIYGRVLDRDNYKDFLETTQEEK